MRRRSLSVRLWTLIALLAILWSLSGAPLTLAEWQALPDRLGLALRLIPHRMRGVLGLWLTMHD